MSQSAISTASSHVSEQPKIPDALIRDMIDGRPFYYKGYQQVLNREKTLTDIMPSSGLQSEIIMYLNFLLTQQLGIKKYRIYTSESGIHLAKNVNYGLDLAVYDKQVLTGKKIDDKYVKVVPKLIVEVDVKVETEELSEEDFIYSKTESLLQYGVDRVIWVTSHSKKVMIAEANKDWIIRSWDKDFILMKGIIANIQQYLDEENIEV